MNEKIYTIKTNNFYLHIYIFAGSDHKVGICAVNFFDSDSNAEKLQIFFIENE